jgi:2-haloacid dehalogenase
MKTQPAKAHRALFKAARTVVGVALAIFVILDIPFPTVQASGFVEPARHGFKAVAFDYYVLFNPDSVVDEVERWLPGRGREFTNLWRTRQFEYTWLRSITHRYVDFSAVTEDALIYAAHALNVPMTVDAKGRLLEAFLHLKPWPDTPDALRQLHEAGLRVITIANFSPAMLRANAENAGLTGLFDDLVSTDANQTYKPDLRAYQLGVSRLHLRKAQIVFAAFGGWDAAGAKSFGYPTVWVNRLRQPVEELGIRPDRTVSDLNGLLDFVRRDAS